MNSYLTNVHHNDPENFIDDPEDFSNIVSDSYVDTGATHSIQLPTKLEQHNWMEDKNTTCSPTLKYTLTSDL